MTLFCSVAGIDTHNFSGGVDDGRAAGSAGDNSIVVELKDEPLGPCAVASYPAALHDLSIRYAAAHCSHEPYLGSLGGDSISEGHHWALGQMVFDQINGQVIEGLAAMSLKAGGWNE